MHAQTRQEQHFTQDTDYRQGTVIAHATCSDTCRGTGPHSELEARHPPSHCPAEKMMLRRTEGQREE